MLLIGDDIKKGEIVFNKGKQLHSQDIGALASVGYLYVDVYKKPKISVISTGDEIIPPDSELVDGCVRDINTYSLCSKITSWGGDIISKSVINDDYKKIKKATLEAINTSDIVFISGGSSVGEKDYTYSILEEIKGSDVLVHGLKFKPGKPTIVANVGGKPVIGLPGHPSSAFLVLIQMLEILFEVYYKTRPKKEYIEAKLDEDIFLSPGRKTMQMVSLKDSDNGVIASVIHGKSGMISLISKAYGYTVIELGCEVIKKGETVKVYPLR